MNKLTDMPIKLIQGNLAFGRNQTVYAYFEVEGFGYEHQDHEQQMAPYNNQINFLDKNNGDIHFLVIPYRMDGAAVLERTLEDVKEQNYQLQPAGKAYLKKTIHTIRSGALNNNSSQYHSYIGIQLDPAQNKYHSGNAAAGLVDGIKGFLDGLNKPVRRAVGLDPYDISMKEIEAYQAQSKALEKAVAATYDCNTREISAGELGFIAEYVFSMSTDTGKINTPAFGVEVVGKDGSGTDVKAIRPNKQSYYELQTAEVIPKDEDTTRETFKLRKVTNGENQEQLVQFLVVSKMPTENQHPGSEWLYQLQKILLFPVGVSIRAHLKSNEQTKKELKNVTLQYADQKQQVMNADDANMDGAVVEAKAGADEQGVRLQKSGAPTYSTSIVIRVAGDDRQELNMRVDEVKRALAQRNMNVRSPYGDSMKYLMEFIPTSTRISKDYYMHMESGVLAGMMFGATTNVGDNRGFLIGFTKDLQKPVFIQPDLAAKNFVGINNVFDSLSIQVAGETGKGKSVFMNLFSLLAALTTGSQVLVIDPKGDRKLWNEGLPFIPKEHINIWTLGKGNQDAGSLDPFRTSAERQEGKSTAMDLLTYLANVDLEDDKYAYLSEAVEFAGDFHDPCIGVVINHLQDLYDNPPKLEIEGRQRDLSSLLGTLRSLENSALASLLFGKVGQEYKTLNITTPIQVIMVENLLLPDKDKVKKRAAEKISEAIMISLTAFTKQFILNTPKTQHKIILQDEAKSIEASEIGREQLDWIKRNGRYYNTSLIEGTQRSRDYSSASHIGMKFCFQQTDKEDARTALGFFNLPQTINNVETIQKFGRGECLFQDIYGRSAVIHIHPIYQELLDALNTAPTTKEEIEKEAKRQKVEV